MSKQQQTSAWGGMTMDEAAKKHPLPEKVQPVKGEDQEKPQKVDKP